MPRQYWNVLSANDQWEVRKEGEARGSLYRTQEEAIAQARFWAATEHQRSGRPTGIRVQNQHGQWREERSYGDDQTPPPG